MKSSDSPPANHTAPNINVTPLIDVLLVLLIIFMVLTPLKPTRFKTLVPEPMPPEAHVKKSPRTLVVEVSTDLRVTLIRGINEIAEGSVNDTGAVAARLAQEWTERKQKSDWKPEMSTRADLPPDERIERTVFVKAPRSLSYGNVAKVIDGIKGAGAQPIGLQTEALPD